MAQLMSCTGKNKLAAQWEEGGYGRLVTRVVYRRIFYGDRIEIDDILWDICFMWSQDIG